MNAEKKLMQLESKAYKISTINYDVSMGEDSWIEINVNPYSGCLHYFYNSYSCGREPITRNKCLVTINNHIAYIYR